MNDMRQGAARAEVDASGTSLSASVLLAAAPERVFQAVASHEITRWWVRPGVFDTRECTIDLRAGGRWRATGVSRGQPYVAEGAVLSVDAPHGFVQTWDGVGTPAAPCTLTWVLERVGVGTRVTLTQAGFASPMACREFAAGWVTSFERLAELFAPEHASEHMRVPARA